MHFIPIMGSQLQVWRNDYVIGNIYKGTDNVWTFFVQNSDDPERRALSHKDICAIYCILETLKS